MKRHMQFFVGVSLFAAIFIISCTKNPAGPGIIPPAAPALVSPVSSSTNQSTDLTLKWASVSGAKTYCVQISTSSSFATTFKIQAGLTATQYDVSDLSLTATYYWRVNATDSIGTGISAWSNVNSFSTGSVDFPAMVSIPGGTFVMGSYDTVDFPMAVPAHSATLSPFVMSKNLITQKLYQEVMGTNPAHWPTTLKHPVEQVSWYNAAFFCNTLSKLAGLDTVYSYSDTGDNVMKDVVIHYNRNGYRLPTEAEYEYACRAGSTTDYYWGKNYPPTTHEDSLALNSNCCWFMTDSESTAEVGTKLPNAWGLYDMSGNLFTWCNDLYTGSYEDIAGGTDPTGSTYGDEYVCRGGSWGYFNCGDIVTAPLASPYRWKMWPFLTSWSVGIRVVRGHI